MAALQRVLRDHLVRTSDAEVQRLAKLSADRTTRGSEQFIEALQGRGRYGPEPTSQLLWCRPVFETAHPVAVTTEAGATLRAPGLRGERAQERARRAAPVQRGQTASRRSWARPLARAAW